jgi:CBS domain containing-hemolysin-like protein
LDDIRGLIDLKDLLHPLAQNQLALDSPIQPWIRPARFVPEATPLHELLHTMQRTRQEVVMVVDEFGGTAGLVTLRDLISEIIGDAYTTADEGSMWVKQLDDQSFLVKAQADLESVNTLLQVDLPLAEEYQSLGGFLMYALQKIPREGDRLVFGDYEWVVLSAEGHRLQEILARRLAQAVESDVDVPVDASGTATGKKLNTSPESRY